ncbi:L(+)-tartrate dehydratase subunit beta [Pigmentiphaga humi]|uniref:L(+)-tartrate dehydratase subunit beta n=1 Tax=Pigmentiphaga humi TaxID=2478468 RepID=A0A3P4B2F6_9BURK|nr:fumarate hydratase C-terminal domain-containing protein [Pigmentiphaga humi]VCU70467.1 L(+)-tartrate dehydratase subunit beta [Pigmentiphaga humi]
MNTHRLNLPVDAARIAAIQAGDLVYLSGDIVITIGLPTHQRMVDYAREGTPLPVDLQGGAFLHLSSYNRESDAPSGYEALYMNPTTSTRYDAYMPTLIRSYGLRIVGGKGGLGEESVEAMRETGCIYLSFLGGGCTLLAHAIREVVAVHWEDYISQFRLVTLRVEDLGPATVGIDAHGNSLYRTLREDAQQRLPGILDELDRQRAQAAR